MMRCVLGLLLLCGFFATAAAQLEPLVVLEGPETGGLFGYDIRMAGDVDDDGTDDYVIGAPKADLGGDRRGQALVYSGADHSLIWAFDGTADLHEFGTSVDGAGDVNGDGHADIVVGEPWPYGSSTAPGTAYVYSGADGSLIHTIPGWQLSDEFGTSVAGVGDIDGDGKDDVAVGAPDYNGVELRVGRVTVYSGADASVLLDVEGWQVSLSLGFALEGFPDQDGDDVHDLLASGPQWIGPYPSGVGAVFVLSGADGSVLVTGEGPDFAQYGNNFMGREAGLLGDVDGDGVTDFFGGGREVLRVWSGADGSVLHHVDDLATESWDMPTAAPLGDVDGDGKDDFVIGDPEADALALNGGRIISVSGSDGEVRQILHGESSYGKAGSALELFGDSDGDGRPEFLVSEPAHSSSSPAFVYLVEYEQQFELWLAIPGGGQASQGFGQLVRGAGDVDNDGTPDVIAGIPDDDTAGGSAGRAVVHSGRDGSVLLEVFGDAGGDRLGWSVDGAGDVDKDGFADVIVGIPFRKTPLAGAARVYSGRTGAVLLDLQGTGVGDRFGMSVAGVGDVDGDGAGDVLVGSPFDDAFIADGGAAYLYSGATGGELLGLGAPASFLAFGNTVGEAGDADGDGVPDLLVGVPNAPVGLPPIAPGTVDVYSGADGSLVRTLEGEDHGDLFGLALGSAGDLDGDGFDDTLVGSPYHGDGIVQVFSGATGAELLLYDPTSNADVGASIAGIGDVDGDDVPDLLVGSLDATSLFGGDGMAQVVSGATGEVLIAYSRFVEDGGVGASVDAIGDVDFDGVPDVMAGALLGPDATDGEIAIWTSGPGPGPWANLGAVLPGTHGAPRLFPTGTLLGGDPVTLELSDARPLASTTLVVGLSELGAPFQGGTMVPALDVLILGLLTDGEGGLLLGATWPPGLPPGTEVFVQAWIADPAAISGYAGSNAIRGTTP